MIGSKTFPAISLLSVGCGFWIGRKYEQWKDKELFNDENNNNIKWLFREMTNVNAFDVPSKCKRDMQRNMSNDTGRLSEITKYGLPEFGNAVLQNDRVVAFDNSRKIYKYVLEHLTGKENESQQNSTMIKYFSHAQKYYKESSGANKQVGKAFQKSIWDTLEDHVKTVANNNKNVYICMGPLYIPKKKMLVKYNIENEVAIPTHFFKVLLIEDTKGGVVLESYRIPNTPTDSSYPLKTYFYKKSAIEKDAGILIFQAIKITTENGHKI